MKKLVYVYENGKEVEHTKFVTNKTIKREAEGSKRVEIYECNENELEERLDGYSAGRYVTTLSVQ